MYLCVSVCGTVKKVCVCVLSIHKIAVLINWDKIPILKPNGEEILFSEQLLAKIEKERCPAQLVKQHTAEESAVFKASGPFPVLPVRTPRGSTTQ